MVPDIAGNGASFRGAGAYYLHDKPFTNDAGERVNPATSDRVAWVEMRNLVADTAEAALDEMWFTAEAHDMIKMQAGVKLTGQKMVDPVKTLSLAWHPDDAAKLSKAAMLEAADGFLEQMGWHGHQALIVAHADTAHPHVHIILNRVHPETGRTLKDYREQKRSQVWARHYEREHPQYVAVPSTKDHTRKSEKSDRGIPNSVEKQGRAQEEPFVTTTATIETLDKTERDLLHARQTEEREAFFASSKQQFREARQAAFVEVRREFRPQWKAHYTTEKMLLGQARELSADNSRQAFALASSGKFGEAWQTLAGGETPDTFNPVQLARQSIDASRAELSVAMKEARVARQADACKALFDARADTYAEMKLRQAGERAELRAMGEAQSNAEAIDLKRLHHLLHGDRPQPTNGNDLMRQLRTANENAAPVDARPASNDNRPPEIRIRSAEVADAQRHIDLLLATARMTASGTMASVQMADVKQLVRRAEREHDTRRNRHGETSDALQQMMDLDGRTDAEKARDRAESQARAHERSRDRGGGMDR
jgi:hypothetical protein